MIYDVISRLSYGTSKEDIRVYMPGEQVDLPPAIAAPLITSGVVAEPKAPPAPAAAVPQAEPAEAEREKPETANRIKKSPHRRA